ncbi:MAG: hypothetical protein H6641_06215 [Caldilineaceae bacterium]|nr:hypothetical protein [Caldilineaceae bacterium]
MTEHIEIPADMQVDDHMPLLAVWYQARATIAEALIPVLAGLKTAWLLAFRGLPFFQCRLNDERALRNLWSPFDPFWRLFTAEPRFPLGAAQFLLFGIAALVILQQGLDVGEQAGVQAGLDAANAALNQSAVSAEERQALQQVIASGVQAGVQVANAQSVQEAIAASDAQITEQAAQGGTLAPAQPDEAPSRPSSLDELASTAIETGQEAAAPAEVASLPGLDAATLKIIRDSIEAGVRAGIDANAAVKRDGGLVQLLVNTALRALPESSRASIAELRVLYVRHVQPFLDEVFVAAAAQLFRRLVAVVFFAYLFSLLLNGQLKAAHSYIFWLYWEALTLVSAAGYLLLFRLFPDLVLRLHDWLAMGFALVLNPALDAAVAISPTMSTLKIGPDIAAFWTLETGLHTVLWLYVAPALVLAKMLPQVNVARALIVTLLCRALLLFLTALLIFGVVTLIASSGLV